MYRIFIGLLCVLNLYACDSLIVWIIYRPNCERIWSFGKYKWRMKSGSKFEITIDTICNLYYNEEKGIYITVECDDTCGVTDTTPYSDSVYSILREE